MTWQSIKEELAKSRFGAHPPPTDEIAERVAFTLEAAQHWQERSFTIDQLAKLVSGEDVWQTRKHLSFSDPLNAAFQSFVDALVIYRADQRGDIVTHQGIILREDVEEARGREVFREDGQRVVEFPIAIPWLRAPVIKENGTVMDCGERGTPLYGKQAMRRTPEKPALKFWKPASLLNDEDGG